MVNPIVDAAEGFVKGVVKPILDKFVPDAKERIEAEQFAYTLAQQINLGQIDINKEEAKSQSLFVAGWRPFVGWACGLTMAYSVIGRDLLNWGLEIATAVSGHPVPALPQPDTTLVFELLMALLGFGGLRTFEKMRGVAR